MTMTKKTISPRELAFEDLGCLVWFTNEATSMSPAATHAGTLARFEMRAYWQDVPATSRRIWRTGVFVALTSQPDTMIHLNCRAIDVEEA